MRHRVVVTMHMTWLVNSAVHMWGGQPYRTGDESRNNWVVALLVFGDGWHNNHHAFQDSAAHGLEWYQVDFSYYLIRWEPVSRCLDGQNVWGVAIDRVICTRCRGLHSV